MRKIFAAILSFLLVLSLLNIPMVSANTVIDWSSSENAINFVKSVELYVKDEQNNSSSLLFDSLYPSIVHNDVPINKDANIELRFNLALPDNHTVKENDVFYIPLPKEIKLTAGERKSLTTEDGDEVLESEITADHRIKITFKKFVEGNSSIEGDLRLSLGFDKQEIGNQNPTEVTFTIPGNTVQNINIPINFEIEKPTIQKSGSYDQSTKTITWSVTVNKEKALATNASIIDHIPTDLTLDESSITVTPSVTDAVYTYDHTTGVFNYKFPGTISEEYVITYNTIINNDVLLDPENNGKGEIPFTNSAQFLYDGSAPNLYASATVTTEEVKLFSKIGTYNGNEKEIFWEFNINESGGFIPNARLEDELPSFLSIEQTTISYVHDGLAQTINADDIDITVLADGREKLTLALGDISHPATVKFTTKISDEFYKQNELTGSFDNTAYLYSTGFGSGPISSQGIVGNVRVAPISKRSTAYDRATGRISWEIVANPNHLELTDMIVSDVMSEGQTLVKESVIIAVYNKMTNETDKINPYDAAGVLNPSSGFSYIEKSGASETDRWSYTVSGKQANMHTIHFQTQIDDTNIYQNNDTETVFTNRVSLEASEITKIDQVANHTVNSEVLNKSVESYNYQTKTFTWKIIVNDNANSLTNVQFTDVIPEGMEYIEHSFQVNGTVISKPVLFDVNGEKQLEYDYPALSDRSEITFQTKLTDDHVNAAFTENKMYPYTNIAQLKHDGISNTINSSATREVKNVVVSKEDQYVNGNDYIDWVVHINSNGVNYDSFIDADGQLVIRDQLANTLRLDTTSVKFYEESLAPNGDYIKGDLVEGVYSADHIKYDANTNNFEFILPDNINKGYRLEFTTYVTTPGNISNSVEFSGVTISHNNHSRQFNAYWNALDGSMSGTRGSIIVEKVDAEQTSKKLEGASFSLIDPYGNVLETLTTDANGQLKFANLRFGIAYKVQEIVAPIGYVLDSSLSDEIKLQSAADKRNYTFIKENTSIKGTIQFDKKGYQDKALEGAEFTLYNATSQAVQTAVSDATGLVTFTNVPYGSYTIQETRAPLGYHLSTDTLNATIEHDQVTVIANPVSISNDIYLSDIVITKTSKSGKALSNAVFQLYDVADTHYVNSLATATSDVNGIVLFEDVPYGDYIIVESKAPAGYMINKNTLAVTITRDNERYDLGTFENEAAPSPLFYGQVIVKKVDESSNPLTEATFGLYQRNGKLVETAITNESGQAIFNDILFGEYYVKEIEAPKGYLLTEAQFKADVFNVEKAVEIVVENVKKIGTVQIIKVSDEQKPLAQAVFALYNSDGIEVERQSTNHLGQLSFTDVPIGQYTVKELTAPPLYELDSQVYEVELVEHEQVVNLQIVNYLIDEVVESEQDETDQKSKDTAMIDNSTYQAGGKQASHQAAVSNHSNIGKLTNSLPKTSDTISNTILIFAASLFLLIVLVIIRFRIRQSKV